MVPLLLPALPLYVVKRVSHCVLPGVSCLPGRGGRLWAVHPCSQGKPAASWGGFTLKFSCDVNPADVKDIGGPLKHPARIFHGDSHSSGSRQEKNGLCLPERTRFHYEVKPRQAPCTCQPVLGFPSDFTLS